MGTRGIKDSIESVNHSHRGTQKLNRQQGNLYGSDRSPLYICYICVAWSSCETSNMGSRGSL